MGVSQQNAWQIRIVLQNFGDENGGTLDTGIEFRDIFPLPQR
jgi:hypothetical protein